MTLRARGQPACGLVPISRRHLEFEDVRTALKSLVPVNREALILVGAQGLSYEQAAQVCGVAVGTIKSRVNRARVHLMELLQLETGYQFGPDDVLKAVVGSDDSDTWND